MFTKPSVSNIYAIIYYVIQTYNVKVIYEQGFQNFFILLIVCKRLLLLCINKQSNGKFCVYTEIF